MKLKILIFLFSIIVFNSFGQKNRTQEIERNYNYKAELTGIKNEWHKIILPPEVFKNIENSLNDIRIFGITEQLDTIEAPYILARQKEEIIDELVRFKMINQVKNDRGYFYTFEVKQANDVNYVKLDFGQQNFNWRINFEGSNDQDEWFSIVEDYRLVAIKNNWTDYKFSAISFPATQYKYYRLQIKDSETAPMLDSSFLQLKKIKEGIFHNFSVKNLTSKENKRNKTTIIEFDLEQPVPVAYLAINAQNDFDYYRKITVQYLSDSLKTEKGWKYNYRNLTTSILNSIEPNVLKFSSKTLQKIRLIIDNQDNQPLKINQILVKGYEHQLIARFSEPAYYFLAYGNPKAKRPNYDIGNFTTNIPSSLDKLKIGPIEKMEKTPLFKQGPLFKNKLWLYGIMGVIILLLGWFSLKMMRNDE
jgi:hypothetical protein